MRKTILRDLSVPVTFIKEGTQYVAYCPVLDLSTCGGTMEEVQRNFGKAVKLFFEELEEMGTLERVLTELGWRKQVNARIPWVPPEVLGQLDMPVQVAMSG